MLTKENLLFCVVGILLGSIVGFIFTNSINKGTGTLTPSAALTDNANLPPGHPMLGANNPGMQAEVQAAIDAAKNEPDNFDAQLKAAEYNYQIQRFDGAIEYLARANKIKPDDYATIVQLGNANFDAGKYAEAEKWYTAALAKKQDDVNVRTDLGLTFVFRDEPNYDRAIQEFKRSLEKDPNNIHALQNLTVAYTKKNDVTNANAILAKLESVEPTNSSIARLREDIQKIKPN